MELDNFIKTAKDLSNTDSSDIIKVAGIIDKIKGLFARLFNTDAFTKRLNLETMGIAESIDKVKEQLKEVENKLAALDFAGYEIAMKDLKNNINYLYSRYSSMRSFTNKTMEAVIKEEDNKKERKREQNKLPPINLYELQEVFDKLKNGESSMPLDKPFKEAGLVKEHLKDTQNIVIHKSENGKSPTEVLLSIFDAELAKKSLPKLTFDEASNIKEELCKAIYEGTIDKITKKDNGELVIHILCVIHPQNINASLMPQFTRKVNMVVSKTYSFIVSSINRSGFKIDASINERMQLLRKFAVNIKTAGDEPKERVHTTVTKDQLINAFMSAWPRVIGGTPTKEHVLMLMAQNALETGWGKSMYNYNIGNIKRLQSEHHDYFMMPHTGEVLNGKQVFFEPPHPATWFKSYDTLEEGVADYLSLLKRRYGSAFEAAKTGDAKQFAAALKRNKYYTAPEEGYAKGLDSIYHSLLNGGDNYSKNSKQENSSSGSSNQTQSKTPDKNKEEDKPKEYQSKVEEKVDSGVLETVADFLKGLSNDLSITAETKPRFKSLSENKYLIVLDGNYTDSIELSKSLTVGIDESIQGISSIKDNGYNIELECSVRGSNKECTAALSEVCSNISDMFKEATNKQVDVYVYPNCKSMYNTISFKKLASNNNTFRKTL